MRQDNNIREVHKTTIGGQALIEGLMMIGPDKKAMAVRNAKGEIKLEFLATGKKSKAETIPFIRGPVRVFKQLVLGTRALMRSADIAESEEMTESEVIAEKEEITDTEAAESTKTAESAEITKIKAEKRSVSESDKSKKNFSERYPNFGLYVSAIVSIFFSVIIFMLLPGLIVDGIKVLFKIDLASRLISLALTLFEGIIRVGIFILYLWLVSKMDEIKRVWQYHGSEHKTIACYEARMPLTVENIREFSRFHPRCGTSFMFLIMIVSIIILAFIGWRSRLVNLIVRLLLLPVIAGITYEIIRLVGRYDNALTRVISKPGMAMQKLTTAEPDDSMIEVAIVAMEAVIPEQEGSDDW
ncbi:MAG TPA: DUF1385 domain-containing protein [Clostridiaceae bacterium]|nr:DUF1385 domain-containing protein [Clostridiaceae bacterium]